MKYKDLFDAQHEYCKTDDYPDTAIRQHAFIAGAKWVIKYLNELSATGALEAITNLHDELQEEEELTKWTLKKMSPFVPNKCESCDRFDECYTVSGRMRELCKMYGANVVFKRKERSMSIQRPLSHLRETINFKNKNYIISIMKNLNAYRDQAYKIACEHGFHEEELSIEHLKCLIVSELMEAVEADRKSNNADMDAFDKYEGLISFDENFERHVKDTVEDELADACIRIFDLAGYKNIDLDFESGKTTIINPKGTLTEKIYNAVHILVGCEQLNRCLILTMIRIFLIAESIGIDIEKHILLKMEYNYLRTYKHGKKY